MPRAGGAGASPVTMRRSQGRNSAPSRSVGERAKRADERRGWSPPPRRRHARDEVGDLEGTLLVASHEPLPGAQVPSPRGVDEDRVRDRRDRRRGRRQAAGRPSVSDQARTAPRRRCRARTPRRRPRSAGMRPMRASSARTASAMWAASIPKKRRSRSRACRCDRTRRCRGCASARSAPSARSCRARRRSSRTRRRSDRPRAASASSWVTSGTRALGAGVSHVPVLDLHRLVAQELERGGALDVGDDTEPLGEQVLRREGLLHDHPGGEQRGPR